MEAYKANPDRCCEICSKRLNRRTKRFCSRECCSKFKSIAYKGRKHTAETISKMKGRKLSSETIEKQNRAKTRDAIRVEGAFECARCRKIFESNTSLRAHKSYCADSRKDDCEAMCDQCGKSFLSQRSAKMHASLVHIPEDKRVERSRKMSESAGKRPFRRRSISEIALYEEIRTVFPDACHSYQINGRGHVYDIYIPSDNIIIEFDGDFWHGNSERYSLTKRMKQQYYIDQSNNQTACKAGIGVVRIWQSASEEFIRGLKEDRTCLRSKLLK